MKYKIVAEEHTTGNTETEIFDEQQTRELLHHLTVIQYLGIDCKCVNNTSGEQIILDIASYRFNDFLRYLNEVKTNPITLEDYLFKAKITITPLPENDT